MQENTGEILLSAIREALHERPIARKVFLDLWRETAGWHGSYSQASQRLSEWLDPANPHRFPVDALPDLVSALGHAGFLDPLLALEAKEQRRARIAKVEPRREWFRLGNTFE